MNILLVYKEADIATYKMLEGLSKLEDFNIYIASPQSYTDKKIYGNCTPLDLPVITSKFNWNVIRALRQIIKTYQIDLILAEQFRFIKRFIRLHRHTGEEYRIPRYAG